jgi:hypothetical protein
LALALVFLVAAWHKMVVVRGRRAAVEPLVALSPWRRRHGTVLLLAVAAVEVLAALLLAALPVAGFGLAAGLLAFYTFEVRRLRPDQDCNCFGALTASDRAGALSRNLVLLALSGAAAGALLSGAVDVAGITQVAIGSALLLVAALAALAALERMRGWTAQRQAYLQRAATGKERA